MIECVHKRGLKSGELKLHTTTKGIAIILIQGLSVNIFKFKYIIKL